MATPNPFALWLDGRKEKARAVAAGLALKRKREEMEDASRSTDVSDSAMHTRLTLASSLPSITELIVTTTLLAQRIVPCSKRRRHGYSADGKICFLNLPLELRKMVYAFRRPSYAINLADPRCAHYGQDQDAMLRVHRAIGSEYRDSYYEKNIFMLDVRTPEPQWKTPAPECVWQTWLASLDDQDAGSLRQLKFLGMHFVVRITLAIKAPRIVMEVKGNVCGSTAFFLYGSTPADVGRSFDAVRDRLTDWGAGRGDDKFDKSDIDAIARQVLPLLSGGKR